VKPGGKLLITDYCRGKPKGGDEFEKYVAKRGYCLLTVPAYGQLLKNAGWTNVENIDFTSEFEAVLKRELKLLESIKNSFVTVSYYHYLFFTFLKVNIYTHFFYFNYKFSLICVRIFL
jgi:hypothetical protein